MAKYEIEIDDETALRWSFDIARSLEPPKEIDAERVTETLAALIERYGKFPRIPGKRDEAAMAICRAIAIERAAQYGARQGDGGIDYVVRNVLDSMLGRD